MDQYDSLPSPRDPATGDPPGVVEEIEGQSVEDWTKSSQMAEYERRGANGEVTESIAIAESDDVTLGGGERRASWEGAA